MKTRVAFLLLLLVCSVSLFGQVVSGNITATGAASCTSNAAGCVVLNVAYNASSAVVTISGTFSATVQFEASGDSANFVNVNAFPLPTLGSGAVQSATAGGQWVVPIAGYQVLRVRCSAFTSGTALVFIQPSMGQAPEIMNYQTFTPAPAQSASGSPQTPVTNSATAAAGTCTATLPGVAGKTTYITGFQVTGGGATGASVITITVTGLISGTNSYKLGVTAGATLNTPALIVPFPIPVPASATNTAIAVNVPSFGAGNTDAACAAQGFQQ